MVESSITEEIREENQSEKSLSDNTPSTSNNKGHVIIREGVTSMFQHSQSLGNTDQGTEGDHSPSHEAADLFDKNYNEV